MKIFDFQRYYDMEKKQKKLRNIICKGVKNKKKRKFKCFIEGCPKRAINSHSQSLSNALRRISKNGYVILPRPSYFMKDNADIDSYFQGIGVGVASTFKGFCKGHDVKDFLPVDKVNEQNITKEALARLAFRTFAYEERTKEESLLFLRYVIKKGANSIEKPNMEKLVASAESMENHLKTTRPYYLNKFVRMFDSQNYEQIYGILFILDKMIRLSCSTMLDPTMIDSDDLMECDIQKPLDQVFFNLIPQTDSSLVIFAHFKEQEEKLKKFIDEYGTLENIVFNHCEEVLLGPDFYSSLDSEVKYKIIKALKPWYRWDRVHFPDLFHVKLDSSICI